MILHNLILEQGQDCLTKEERAFIIEYGDLPFRNASGMPIYLNPPKPPMRIDYPWNRKQFSNPPKKIIHEN
jgi:hypothetical protein